MHVAWLGLGAMGRGIVVSLARAGHEVRAWNRTPRRDPALQSAGVTVADTLAEACAGADACCTILADDAAVGDVVWGTERHPGLLRLMAAGCAHVSLSTISTDLSARLARAHDEREQLYVAAPVFGRPDAAAAARLTVVAAGADAAIAHCRPILEPIGQTLFVVGPDPVMANMVKLGGNFLIAAMIEALGEAFALMRKSGISPDRFLEIVNGNLFRSPVYENYGGIIAAGRFDPPGFRLRLGLKDVGLILAAAEQAAVPMPLASIVRDQLLAGIANGRGDLDWSALSESAARAAGLPT